MTTNNRQSKSSDHGNNPPGLAHVNAFLISENADVDGDYRSRKSSVAGMASSRRSFGNAFQWLQRSGLVSFVTGLSDARQPAPQPPCDAPHGVLGTSSGQVPIQGFDAPGKLFQSFPGAVRSVRRMQPVCPSVGGHRLAEIDTRCESNKRFSSHRSNGFWSPYAYVNGNSRGVFIETSESYQMGDLMVTLKASK
jgi:hypothetical protein